MGSETPRRTGSSIGPCHRRCAAGDSCEAPRRTRRDKGEKKEREEEGEEAEEAGSLDPVLGFLSPAGGRETLFFAVVYNDYVVPLSECWRPAGPREYSRTALRGRCSRKITCHSAHRGHGAADADTEAMVPRVYMCGRRQIAATLSATVTLTLQRGAPPAARRGAAAASGLSTYGLARTWTCESGGGKGRSREL